ncbi:hypothetical protein J121_95 [Qipengyuania citrea LAMA 915]|uniref:Uncharacterized protein n=1 Tax=Qipengyuania citrea LAMA 915 TaxID=1306953 RepID=A0A0L1KD91_9SPHN|nr:hypothetical protein [Qipengyuania citrea]KNH01896.1 hypothetical protein J121_95 [Qipengyuania citrea LAMA 915]
MNSPDRSPGWDKRAVNRIAKEQYGGLREMFAAHGWSIDGRVISQIAPTKVVGTYRSIEAFDLAHANGRDKNFILDPLAVLREPEPKVLLTSYFGFTPWDWPCLTFTDETRRDTIVAETRPGFLAVIYGSTSRQTPESQRGKLMGIYQCSHRTGPTDQFLSPAGLQRKRAVEPKATSWSNAIEAIRAWSIPPDIAPFVADFAPTTYDPDAGTAISRYGRWLAPDEARKILDLELVPEPTFWGSEVVQRALAPSREALKPSRPGPVSQSGYFVAEAEGPKHLYILRLVGNADHFLGRRAGGRSIIKVGSDSRCRAHNSALPKGAFGWEVLKSTLIEGREPFAPSHAAKFGEQQMIRHLVADEGSLGGEFFLASDKAIEDAWALGVRSAEEWKP